MGWRKLTSIDAQPVWVNLSIATAVVREGKRSIIVFEKGNTRSVKEALEDVMSDIPTRGKVLRSGRDRRAPK